MANGRRPAAPGPPCAIAAAADRRRDARRPTKCAPRSAQATCRLPPRRTQRAPPAGRAANIR
eukprot:1192503-Prymnesium_polylepis.1